jgi:FKBP-type peptidyl-prolyl cis-trans isomerase FkpA
MPKNNMKQIVFAFAIFTVFACQKELSEEEQLAKDIELIEQYLAENNLEAERTLNGLFYIIEKTGNGNFPATNSEVTVRYKGYFLDGKVFDQSTEFGVTFNLQSVIRGWTDGIPKFSVGGEGKLLIPSKLGYGPNARQGIPANSVLIFEVKLLDIN